MKQYIFDALFKDRDPDPEGILTMIYGHARIAGWYGLPRQEYADDEAEKASIEGYERGIKQRQADGFRDALATAREASEVARKKLA